jgi:hypothetical protein
MASTCFNESPSVQPKAAELSIHSEYLPSQTKQPPKIGRNLVKKQIGTFRPANTSAENITVSFSAKLNRAKTSAMKRSITVCDSNQGRAGAAAPPQCPSRTPGAGRNPQSTATTKKPLPRHAFRPIPVYSSLSPHSASDIPQFHRDSIYRPLPLRFLCRCVKNPFPNSC